MGSSFVEYRGRGFWVGDSRLEVWLYLLATEIDRRSDDPDWLASARDHWYEQATVGFVGCINADLDQIAASDARREDLINLSEAAVLRLEARGESIGRDELNAMGTGSPGSEFLADMPTDALSAVGERFIQLLKGEVVTTSATSDVL